MNLIRCLRNGLALLVLAVNGCASEPTPTTSGDASSNPLASTSWSLERLTTVSSTFLTTSPVEVSLVFDAHNYVFDSPCSYAPIKNQYSFAEDRITQPPAAVNASQCNTGDQTLDPIKVTLYDTAALIVTSYAQVSLSKDQLTLNAAAGTLQFHRSY